MIFTVTTLGVYRVAKKRAPPIAVGIYSAFCLIDSRDRLRVVLSVASMYVAAAAICAVQLLTTAQASGESVRYSGVTIKFASKLSLAPENLLTLFVPGLFGDMVHTPYWGRWYLWEMSLFVGVSGCLLAFYGAAYGNRKLRRFSVTLILILLVAATKPRRQRHHRGAIDG